MLLRIADARARRTVEFSLEAGIEQAEVRRAGVDLRITALNTRFRQIARSRLCRRIRPEADSRSHGANRSVNMRRGEALGRKRKVQADWLRKVTAVVLG